MTDVFISYAREDGEFVRRLDEALRAADRQGWVDWEGIPPTAEWMREIYAAIEAADTFIAVPSPTPVRSEICRAESAYAERHGKRLVPIVVADVDPAETPEELATGRELGPVGLGAYLGKSARDFGAGDIALTERCVQWPELEAAPAAQPELAESPRWRVAASETSVLLFARQAGDRIAEACRRVPRQLTPDEWSRLMPDEPFRPSCEAAPGSKTG